MANSRTLVVAQPAPGTSTSLSSAGASTVVFDFPFSSALFTREGNDLVLSFDEGAAVRLQDFYTSHHESNLPDFEVDGAVVRGSDFFAALGDPSVQPAAGPQSLSGGRHTDVHATSSLLDGIGRLDGLDVSFDNAASAAEAFRHPVGDGEIDNGVSLGTASLRFTLFESGLENGSGDGGATATGSLHVSAPDGVASIVVGGVAVVENGALTGAVVTTPWGSLEATGWNPATGELVFEVTLTSPVSHPDGSDEAQFDFPITVTDTDGSTATGTIAVEVRDDAPVFGDVVSEEATENSTATGDLTTSLEGSFELSFGADGQAADALVVNANGTTYEADSSADGNWVFTLPEGTLTVTDRGDGTFGYEFAVADDHANSSFDFDFTLTAEDADGDRATSEPVSVVHDYAPTVELPDPGNPDIAADSSSITADEGDESTWTGSASFELDLHGEDGTVTVGGVTVAIENGKPGECTGTGTPVHGVTITSVTLTQTSDGKWTVEYTYSFDGSEEHGKPGSTTDDLLEGSIPVQVADGSGNVSNGSVHVSVKDDEPSFGDFTPAGETTSSTATGDLTTSLEGSFELSFGADGQAAKPADALTITVGGTTYKATDTDGSWVFELPEGTLTVTDNGNGTFGYEFSVADDHTNTSFEFDFTVTAQDADGDTVTSGPATVVHDFTPTVELPDPGNPDIAADSSSITADEGDESTWTGSASFELDLHGEDGVVTVGGVTVEIRDGVPGQCTGTGTPVHGVTITSVTLTQTQDGKWTVEYTYSFDGSEEHGTPGSPTDDLLEGGIPVQVTDGSGNVTDGSVHVSVKDDIPSFGAFAPAGETTDSTATGDLTTSLEGSFELSFGADGQAAKPVDALTITVGDETYEAESSSTAGNWVFTLPEGTLTVTDNGDGTFGYEFSVAVDHTNTSFEFDFTVTATDADGDTVTSGSASVVHDFTPTVELPDPQDPDIAADSSSISADEGDESTWTGSASFELDLHGEDGVVTVGGVTVEIRDGVAGQCTGTGTPVHGVTITSVTLVPTQDGKWTVEYTYSFDGSTTHGAPGSPTDEVVTGSIPVEVTDGSGDTTVGSIGVSVKDDEPFLDELTASSVVDTEKTFEVGLNGLDLGADYESGTVAVQVGNHAWTFKVEKEAGNFVFKEDGKPDASAGSMEIRFDPQKGYYILFTRSEQDVRENTTDTYDFHVTVTDSDGDTTVSEDVTVQTEYVEARIEVAPEDLSADESALVGNLGQISDSGSFKVDLNGQTGTVRIGDTTFTINADGSVSASGPNGSSFTVNGKYGDLTVDVEKSGDGTSWEFKYGYTLKDSVQHGGKDTVEAEHFNIVVNGRENGQADDQASFGVSVTDDRPFIGDAGLQTSTYMDTSPQMAVMLKDVYIGGDYEGATVVVHVSNLVTGKSYQVNLTYNGLVGGYPQFNGDNGAYMVYDAKDDFWYLTVMRPEEDYRNNDILDTYEITLTVTDGDGDPASYTYDPITTTMDPSELGRSAFSSVEDPFDSLDDPTREDAVLNSLSPEDDAPAASRTAVGTEGTDADAGLENLIEEYESPLGGVDDHGVGDGMIFGMSGYDLVSDAEQVGGDFIHYDPSDCYISGGQGIDFLVTDRDVSLDDLLSGTGREGENPRVEDVEVLLRGDAAPSLTDMNQLAREYGINMSEDGNSMTLSNDWTRTDDGTFTFNGGAEHGGLTLELDTASLQVQKSGEEENAQYIVKLSS